jgi:hypothetical protein
LKKVIVFHFSALKSTLSSCEATVGALTAAGRVAILVE